jgi:hypothetical protein
MIPRPRLLTSSGSKKKEPKRACLSDAKASHSHKMWAEVSSPAPHLLHKGLLVSPIKYRRFLWVLCPVGWPVTTLDCVLLKGRSLVVADGLGPKINFRACLWVLIRDHHITICWSSFQLTPIPTLHETCDPSACLSLSPTALQPGVGLGLLQEFLPSFPV